MDPNKYISRVEFRYPEGIKKVNGAISVFYCTFPECKYNTVGFDTWNGHKQIEHHRLSLHECRHCELGFSNKAEHEQQCSPTLQTGAGIPSYKGDFKLLKEAHDGAAAEYKYKFVPAVETFEAAFERAENELVKLIKHYIQKNPGGVQACITADVIMESVKTLEEFHREFYSPYVACRHPSFIKSKLQSSLARLNDRLALYKDAESGSTLKQVNSFHVKILPAWPYKLAGKYMELPRKLKNKGIVNIQTSKNCFHLSVLHGLHKAEINRKHFKTPLWEQLSYIQRKRAKRIYEKPNTYSPFLEKHKFDGFKGTLAVEQIPFFEELNPNISVTAFEYNNGNAYPIYMTLVQKEFHVNLLLLSKNGSHHWTYLPDPDKLFKSNRRHGTALCRYCLQRIEPGTTKHEGLCLKGNPCRMKFPVEDSYTFKKMRSFLPPVFRIFYHLDEKFTGVISWGILVMNCDNAVHDLKYRQNSSVESFFVELRGFIQKCQRLADEMFEPIQRTPELEKQSREAQECFICNNRFDSGLIARRLTVHHNHMSKDLDLFPYTCLCSGCNVLVVQTSVVVLSNDLASKDGELFLKYLDPNVLDKFEIIGRDASNIISLRYDKVNLLDFSRFLKVPVYTMGSWLSGNKEIKASCPTLFSVFNNVSTVREKLDEGVLVEIAQNGILQSLEHVQEGIPLSEFSALKESTEKFFANSCRSNIQVFDELYTYYHLCMLADVVWRVDRLCFENFKISCLHSPTIHSFAFDGAMAYTQATFKYLKDTAMIKFVGRSIIGPLEVSSLKLATGKSERLGDDIVANKDRKENVIFDLNSVYMGCCALPLAVGDYEWVFDAHVENLPANKGRLYEVDIRYPSIYHTRDDALPLCPYKRKINLKELGDGQQAYVTQNMSHDPLKLNRVCLDFYDRKNLVIHHRALSYYISRGLVVAKVHKALQFTEAPVLKPMVDLVAELRRKAFKENDKVTVDLCKVIGVSIYGQMLKNKEKYTDTRLSFNKERTGQLSARHNFSDATIISPNLVLFKMAKCSFVFDTPWQWAASVLWDSKVAVNRGRDRFQDVFPEAKLAKVQTDSLAFLVPLPNNDLNQRLASMSDILDFSNLPQDHMIRKLVKDPDAHCMTPMKWKIESENGCCRVKEIVSIRPKLFSYLYYCENPECKMSKDVVKGLPVFVRNEISHSNFKRMLQLNALEWQRYTDSGFQHKRRWHALDVSRYLCPDGINTLSFGNWRIGVQYQHQP